MTRFARAKGSKSSNERVPEQATSWQVMKQQLEQKKQDVLDAKKHKEFETIRKANYKAFLDERENNVEMEWTEFEGSSKTNKNLTEKNKKKKKTKAELQNDGSGPKLQDLISEIEKTLDKEENIVESKKGKGQKKSKSKVLNKISDPNENIQQWSDDDDDDAAPEETSAKIVPSKNKVSLKLPKKGPLKIPSVRESIINETENIALTENKSILTTLKKSSKMDKTDKKSKINQGEQDSTVFLKKSKSKEKSKINHDKETSSVGNQPKRIEDLPEDQIKRITKKREKRMRQLQNRKKFKAEQKEKALKEEQNQNIKKRKLPKERDNQEHKRRKADSQITKININGVDIEIDYFDGFPVKKEDAQRLHKLRKEMISKSIPRNEVQIALKLERRKAEKALAREKKRVCFNCRKSGHVLSECPDLNENSSHEMIGSGICFKCGSTEHTHFDCKVVRNDAFKFATCFICREQGHISRQCPDNQKGLYPKGGACRVCGDVTHLKKDCPKFQAEQESQTIKLDTLEFNNVESLSDEKQKPVITHNKTNKKVVKF